MTIKHHGGGHVEVKKKEFMTGANHTASAKSMRDSMLFDDVLMRHCVIFCFIFVYKSDSNDPNKRDPVEANKRDPACALPF